jgi:hypothetical protein
MRAHLYTTRRASHSSHAPSRLQSLCPHAILHVKYHSKATAQAPHPSFGTLYRALCHSARPLVGQHSTLLRFLTWLRVCQVRDTMSAVRACSRVFTSAHRGPHCARACNNSAASESTMNASGALPLLLPLPGGPAARHYRRSCLRLRRRINCCVAACISSRRERRVWCRDVVNRCDWTYKMSANSGSRRSACTHCGVRAGERGTPSAQECLPGCFYSWCAGLLRVSLLTDWAQRCHMMTTAAVSSADS